MTLQELKELKDRNPKAFADYCLDEFGFYAWVKVHIFEGEEINPEDLQDLDSMMNCITQILSKVEQEPTQ